MKKLLLLSVVIFTLGLAACESKKGNEDIVTLQITSGQTMEFSHEQGIGEITYILEGATKGAKPTVRCSAEWISEIKIEETITFTVAANETEEARITPMIVTYGSAQQQVIIRQTPASEVSLTASYFVGEYYGSIYSPGMGNYFLHFSDNGFDDNGKDKPNSKYYAVDLYAPLYEGPSDGEITLPLGTYTLNTDTDPVLWSIGWEYSGYRESNEDGASYDPYTYDHATLTVTEDAAILECSIEGIRHRVKYSGKATITYALD